MEIIVFKQEELVNALAAGCKSICLCDNNYRLPAAADTSFFAIGNVTAEVLADSATCERINMRFVNFTPKYINGVPVSVPLKYSGAVNKGSFVTSGGSFLSSYRMSGSYQLLTSYTTSYTTSYRSSYGYVSSFASSFSTSFRPTSSFKGSFALPRNDNNDGIIAVFGYGINLI